MKKFTHLNAKEFQNTEPPPAAFHGALQCVRLRSKGNSLHVTTASHSTMLCLHHPYQSLPNTIQGGFVFKTDSEDLKNTKQPPSQQHSKVSK